MLVLSIVRALPPLFNPLIVTLSAPLRSTKWPAIAPEIVHEPPNGLITTLVYEDEPPLAFKTALAASVVLAQTRTVIAPVCVPALMASKPAFSVAYAVRLISIGPPVPQGPEGVGVFVAVDVEVAVFVALGVNVEVDVEVAVEVEVAVFVALGVKVEVEVAVAVSVAVGVNVSVAVAVAVDVLVEVAVDVSVAVEVAVDVAVAAGIDTLPSVVDAVGVPSLNLKPG